jgi:hypothetical protein|tara:strand:- start:56 stop:334 length:279 start_codon:yes stop_codon:yes gene_type:complete
MYYIKYECDLFGDHKAAIELLCEVHTIEFCNQIEALKFIEECTSALTKPWDVCPWLSDNCEMFEEPPNGSERIDSLKNIHLIANDEDFKNLL